MRATAKGPPLTRGSDLTNIENTATPEGKRQTEECERLKKPQIAVKMRPTAGKGAEKPPSDRSSTGCCARNMNLAEAEEPILFREVKWPIAAWSLDEWRTHMGHARMPFRKGAKVCQKNPQWERTCETVELNFDEFLALQNDNEYWYYFDYKYMNSWFPPESVIRQSVDWRTFGLRHAKSDETTVWIGSKGAHTPCHYDTYGYNLIAQIYGRKQWIIFPPSENLCPTRIPYEESSVYSALNFSSPDPQCFKGVSNARIVVLEPGDVLFLPHKWWHYVENLETSISMNVWMPYEQDFERRVEEAVVQLLVAELAKSCCKESQDFLLNPNSGNILETSLREYMRILDTSMDIYKHEEENPRRSWDTLKPTGKSYFPIPVMSDEEFTQFLISQRNKYSDRAGNEGILPDEQKTLRKFINAMCHPKIVTQIKTNLLK